MLEKYKNMSVASKAALWFVICSLIQKGISFITIPIFTRIMSVNDYGIYNLYLSWFQIFTIITSLYLYFGVFNNAMIKYESEKNEFISSMQSLIFIITLIVFVIYIIFNNAFNEILGLSMPIVLLMFFQLLFDPAKNFWMGKQRFEYKYKKLVIITLIQSVLNPIIGIFMVYCLNNDVYARIFSIIIVEVGFSIPIMIYQFYKGKTFVSKKYWGYALPLAIPLIPHYLSGIILNQGDRIIISKLVNNSAVALYSIAYSIGMIAQIFTNALVNSYTPLLYKNFKNKNYDENRKNIIFLLIITAVLSIVMTLFAPELIKIFGTSEYADAIYVVPPIAASVYFIFLYNIFAIPQFYYEKTSFLMISSIIAVVVNIILNIIFINIFGYIAAAYTTLICYILYSGGHYLISNNILRKNNISNLYNRVFIITISIFVILINLSFSFLYKYMILRYIIVIVIFCILICKKNKIINMFKNLK